MKAILIDSENRKIREIDFAGTYEEMTKVFPNGFCAAFRIKANDKNNICWVDDEGLLNDPKHFFANDYGNQPYAGNGLILGVDEQGCNVDCSVPFLIIEAGTLFLSLSEVQELIREGIVNYDIVFEADGKKEIFRKIDLGAFDERT